MIQFVQNKTLNWALNDMLDLAAYMSSDSVLAPSTSGLPYNKEQTIDYIDERLEALAVEWPEVYTPSVLFEIANCIDLLFTRK
ncbi:MAG: hypothetical protein ACTSPB_10845 [Candidatus Thorarchaeota archaeon]